MLESDYNIGNLHAGVVNIVLDIDRMRRLTQHTDKGIPKNRIAKMSDMGGFIGIDAGVLDQDFVFTLDLVRRWREHLAHEFATIEARVDVSSAGYFKRLYAGNVSQSGYEFLRRLPRRLAQALRQIEGNGQGVLAKRDLRRLLDDDILEIELMVVTQPTTDTFGKNLLEVKVQAASVKDQRRRVARVRLLR